MTKKSLRLFWSYDIVKTEQWLSQMALEGYTLKDMNFYTSIFTFEKTQSENIIYKIAYDKSLNKLTSTLKNSGWEIAVENKMWVIYKNKDEDIEYYPQVQGVIDRLDRISKGTTIALTILGFYYILALILNSFIVRHFISVVEGKRVPAPYGILDLVSYGAFICSLSLLILLIIILGKAKEGIKVLVKENEKSETRGQRKAGDYSDKVTSISNSKLIKIRKKLWVYNSNKLISWLEEQAKKGMILRQVKNNSIFCFEEGEPQNIKYFMDMQKNTTSDYFNINKDAGFTLILQGKFNFGKVIIWSKKYNQGEDIIEFYSNREERLASAKRLMFNNIKWAIYYIIIGISQLYIGFSSIFIQKSNESFWMLLSFIWIANTIYYSVLLSMSIGSYIKTKERINF